MTTNFTEVEKFAENNDIEGFKSFLEKIYLRAGFMALLSIKSELRELDGEFCSLALKAWLDCFKTFISKSNSMTGLVIFANALVFCITETKAPIDQFLKDKDGYFTREITEYLRRLLFSFLRNTPPGEKRLRPRKALLMLGFASVKDEEDSFTPLVWKLYCAVYRFDISGDSQELKVSLKKNISSAQLHDISSAFAVLPLISRLAAEKLSDFLADLNDIKWSIFQDKLTELLAQPIKKLPKPMPELEVLYLSAPEPVITEENEHPLPEILLDEMEILFQSLCENTDYETLQKLVKIVRESSEDDYDRLYLYLQENGENFALKDEFRRELKILMADGDLPESMSERAMALLPFLGFASSPKRATLAELTKLYEEDEGAEEESILQDTMFAPVKTVSLRDDLRFELHETIITLLEKKISSDELKKSCLKLLASNDDVFIESYIKIFEIHILKSGRILFEKIISFAKAFIEFAAGKEGYSQEVESAKTSLLYILYYKDCPDIIKMEAFEPLSRGAFLDFKTSNSIKRYALAFAKDSLARYSQGAACRSLADFISIRLPSSARNASFEGKQFNKLMEEFVLLVTKERNGYDILNHITFEDPLRLRFLSDKIQPVNYKGAIETITQLVLRHNRWAGLILVETAGQDFTDIRNYAVSALGEAGRLLSPDLRERAIKLILEKADECYDDDMRKMYLDTAIKVDPEKASDILIMKCINSGLNERKEFGSLLLLSLGLMESDKFLDFFEKGTRLESLHRYLKSSPKDLFIMEFSARFTEIYRHKFLENKNEAAWKELFRGEDKSRLSVLISEIWNLR